MKRIEVVAAVIRRGDRIFATQRGYGAYKDWWEFPGGKMEAGETPREALQREIREELDAEIRIGRFLQTVEWDYPEFHLTMHCFWCSLASEALHLNEHEAARWLGADELSEVRWLPADEGLLPLIADELRDGPVDVVLPWVDGSDPALAARRAQYATGDALSNEEVGGSTRYASVGEIRWCVASLLRYAPFVRKVFIVTDGQDPDLGGMLRAYFPERVDDVVVVDHRVIFRGREDKLPTFNSNSIDTLIWNIPELSERFLYTNDDVMLIRPATPADFFRDGRYVCYAKRLSAGFVRLLRRLRPQHVGYKVSMLRALELLGGGDHILNLGHTPCAMAKSWFVRWAEERPDMVENNLRDKFRTVAQFEVQEAFYLDEERRGRVRLVSDTAVSLLFKRCGDGYVEKKLRAFRKDVTRKFVCFNALNLCSDEEIAQVTAWLDERILPASRK